MKKNLLMLSIGFAGIMVLAPCIAFAQGNLQFNRAVLVSSSQTVPANKVWKVESALINSSVPPPASCSQHSVPNSALITVNGSNIYVFSSYWGQGTGCLSYDRGPSIAATNMTAFPIWLPAGSTVAASSNVAYVSVIEFNLVP